MTAQIPTSYWALAQAGTCASCTWPDVIHDKCKCNADCGALTCFYAPIDAAFVPPAVPRFV